MKRFLSIISISAVILMIMFSMSFAGPLDARPEINKKKSFLSCPNPGIADLSAQLVRKTGNGKGRIKLIATVNNNSSSAFESKPGQQSVFFSILFKSGLAKSLISKDFQNLAPGQQIQLTHEMDWSNFHDDIDWPTAFKAAILYDPDIRADGNPKNDDCNVNNNEKTLPVDTVDALVR